MRTPVDDFTAQYAGGRTLRLHMPGHKGKGPLSAADITEIGGADVLYRPRGILRESEENAAALFGSRRTVYSAEGSSLCIRAMLCLARMDAEKRGRSRTVLAGRNAHRAFMTAAALLDLDVSWLYGESRITCCPGAEMTARAIAAMARKPAAVYLTSPDYLGNRADIAGIAEVCRESGVPLLVDNAHGAYLRFLEEDLHPLALGAAMTCDSAHKTLPCLTGGAYLHIARNAPELFSREADRAMALFASTSPSWLILASLDRVNRYLAESGAEEIRSMAKETERAKDAIRELGYGVTGEEPLKITLTPKAYGYTGEALTALLREKGIECEFADPDFLVMMVTPQTGRSGLERLLKALERIPRRAPVPGEPPELPRPERAMSIRKAMLSPSEEIPVEQSEGRILADAGVMCPPAVPVAVCGERIDRAAIDCFRYYGTGDTVTCVEELCD